MYSGICPAHPVEREEKREEEREEDREEEVGKREGGQDMKEGGEEEGGGGEEDQKKTKKRVRRGAEGVQRVLSCSLNQNWVRHSCILWRPFQVPSVTQYEAVASVSMATRTTERDVVSNRRCAGSIM